MEEAVSLCCLSLPSLRLVFNLITPNVSHLIKEILRLLHHQSDFSSRKPEVHSQTHGVRKKLSKKVKCSQNDKNKVMLIQYRAPCRI